MRCGGGIDILDARHVAAMRSIASREAYARHGMVSKRPVGALGDECRRWRARRRRAAGVRRQAWAWK